VVSDRTGGRRLAVAGASALLALLITATFLEQAEATFPGKNGRIAYTDNAGGCCGDIHLVKPDGSGDRNITNTGSPTGEYQASFSPNGRKLVFDRDDDIWIVSSKGKGLKRLTTSGDVGDAAFSANGRKIVFVRSAEPDLLLAQRRGSDSRDIWIMRKNGSRQRQLTSAVGGDTNPTFAANGKLIAFASDRNGTREIFTMRPNGKREKQLTDNEVADYQPSFSPDSKRIVFARNGAPGGIYSMKKNGGGVKRLTVEPTADANTTIVDAPTFSPNGKRIAYRRLGAPNQQLVTIGKSGGNEQVVVDAIVGDVQSPDWGPKPSKKKRRHRR
jgi:Tol biopolymer transport system component